MNSELDVESSQDGLILPLLIQPQSSRDALRTIQDRHLKISLCAAPEKNSANQALIKFIAKELGFTKSKLKLLSGHKNRRKRLLLVGYHDLDELLYKLQQKMTPDKKT